MERNLCAEAECKAACCRDMYFAFDYKEEEILHVFPEATRLSKSDLMRAETPGVYYYKILFGPCKIRIVGVCPKLDGINCSIYDNRLIDCEHFKMGSGGCIEIREEEDNKIGNL